MSMAANVAELQRQQAEHKARRARLWGAPPAPARPRIRAVRWAEEPSAHVAAWEMRHGPVLGQDARHHLLAWEFYEQFGFAPIAEDEAPSVHSLTTVASVIWASCRHFGVSKVDLVSHRRHAIAVRARQVAMYVAKTTSLRSLPEIGRRIGGRDHSTVLHAVRKIQALIDNSDARTIADVAAVRDLALEKMA